MFAISWRAVPFGGLILALSTGPASAQDPRLVTLDDALELSGVAEQADTRVTNPRLLGPRAESEAAAALVDQARLRPNPEVSFEVENVAGSGAFSGLQSTEYTLSVGQRLELGGKRSARVGAAEAQAELASLRAELTEAELGQLVRERYLLAVAAAARVELAEDVVARGEELARIGGVLVEVGREPPLRALRADAALAEARARLVEAKAESLSARTALAALWASSEAPLVPADFPNIIPPEPLMSPATESLNYRVARAESAAAAAEIERQRSLGTPDPTVSAGVRRFEESGDNAFLIGVSIPLPFRDRNQGNIAAAEARLRAANAREAVARVDHEQSVATARARYLGAGARVETLSQTSLPQAEEALRLVRI
ncbi:metal transporter [Altererythrobacter sp. B11]|uniref:TolC family protein n=1 Tax=Altererythrobacter sp. B11 TaxID=2060312 RepID=UPI000DC72625|nr:TolC family protein [Altererythrobacter sp. B11]BBC74290.1 metal transporter [Altererythrobacter sp. B11]